MKNFSKANLSGYIAIPKLYFKQWLIDDDEPAWKRPKLDTIVNEFIVGNWQLYRGKVLYRQFYVTQRWFKRKKELNIQEIVRYISGEPRKVVFGLYSGMGYGTRVSKCDYDPVNANFNSFTLNYNYRVVELNQITDLDLSKTKYWSLDGYFDAEKCGMNLGLTEIFTIFKTYEKYPLQIEWLMKKKLADELFKLAGQISWSKKGIAMLGFDNANDFSRYREIKVYRREFRKNREDIYKFKINSRTRYKSYLYAVELIEEYDFKLSNKLIDYIEAHDFYEYRDYIRMKIRLGENQFNSVTKYPANLKLAHDEVMKRVEIHKSQELIDRFKEQFEKYKKMAHFNDSLIIRPVKSPEELIQESMKLDHCVKLYADRVAKGETEIFFVRTKDAATEPFITVELKDNKIVQCRGAHNCKPPEYVAEFVETWANKYKLQNNYATSRW